MKPERLVDKERDKLMRAIKRHYGSCSKFLSKNNYTSGFKGLNLQQTARLLGILSTEKEAYEMICNDSTKIIVNLVDHYREHKLIDYEDVCRTVSENVQQVDFDVQKAVYTYLSTETEDSIMRNKCQKLVGEVGPDTAIVANYLLLFKNGHDYLNGDDRLSEFISRYEKESYQSAVQNYKLNKKEIENIGRTKSYVKSEYYRRKFLTNTDRNAFINFCFFKAQCIIENERHRNLHSPKSFHLSIAKLLTDVCTHVLNRNANNLQIKFEEQFLEMYSQQIRAIRNRERDNYTDSAYYYFLSADAIKNNRSGREVKLVTWGYRMLAKNTNNIEERINIYQNAIYTIKNKYKKNKDIVGTVINEFKLEKQLCRCKIQYQKYKQERKNLRKELGKANRIQTGKEKFMNESTNFIQQTLDEISKDPNDLN
jgi:hypothetical protein